MGFKTGLKVGGGGGGGGQRETLAAMSKILNKALLLWKKCFCLTLY